MTPLTFNTCLALGWLLVVLGVAGLHSVFMAALVGGILVLAFTIWLALRIGVRPAVKPRKEESDVS